MLVFVLTRKLLESKTKKRQERINKINDLLIKINNDPNALTSSVINFFNKSILEFIFCFEDADRKKHGKRDWEKIKAIISEKVLKPQAKRLSLSRDWFKRYLATRCYELGTNLFDEKELIKLVKDDVFLVSVNAAMLIFHNPTTKSINEVIDSYSKGRRILQTTLVNILLHTPIENTKVISDIIIKRLYVEEDIYTRIFCYRILLYLKPSGEIHSIVEKDLMTDDLDLKIAVLIYLEHVEAKYSKPILLKYLNDPHFEIRTIVVKLLGDIGDKSLIPELAGKLSDPEWWVRINTANVLGNLGEEGLAVLRAQTAQKDRFAYETAQAYLEINKK